MVPQFASLVYEVAVEDGTRDAANDPSILTCCATVLFSLALPHSEHCQTSCRYMSTVYLAIIVWRPTATDLSSESTLRSVADTLGIIRMKVRNMLQGHSQRLEAVSGN